MPRTTATRSTADEQDQVEYLGHMVAPDVLSGRSRGWSRREIARTGVYTSIPTAGEQALAEDLYTRTAEAYRSGFSADHAVARLALAQALTAARVAGANRAATDASIPAAAPTQPGLEQRIAEAIAATRADAAAYRGTDTEALLAMVADRFQAALTVPMAG